MRKGALLIGCSMSLSESAETQSPSNRSGTTTSIPDCLAISSAISLPLGIPRPKMSVALCVESKRVRGGGDRAGQDRGCSHHNQLGLVDVPA